MSRLGYIQNSYGSQFNVGIANTYSNNVLSGNNLPVNSIIVSSNINDEDNDTGTYSLLVTDYQGNPIRLTYTIEEGNGLYYDEKSDSLSLHIDNKTIINKNGVLSSTLTNSINNTLIKSNNNKLYIDTQSIQKATENELGIGTIDNSTIKSDEGTIYVDTNNLQYSNTDSNIYGIGIGDGKTIKINNGKMSIDENGFNHANNNTQGVVKPDNITVKTNRSGILSVDTENLNKASSEEFGIVKVDGNSILSYNGEISINPSVISIAKPTSFGVSKVNTQTLNLKDGIISFKDYYTIKTKIENYQNINIEYEKKIEEFTSELSKGNYFYKNDDIIAFNVNETSVTTLEKPKYLEEVIKMLDQYVNIDFNIVTTCDFNVSVIFDRNTNEFPSVTLLKVNYNDEFEYDGEVGILQDTVYPSTEGNLKKLTLKFWAKNFNNSVIGESLVTSLKVTVSNVNDIKKQKTEKYSIIRYNSLYEKHEDEKAELEDDEYVIIENSIRWRETDNQDTGFKSHNALVNWKISKIDIQYKIENVKTNEIFSKEKNGIEIFTFMDKTTDTNLMNSNSNTRYGLGYPYTDGEISNLDTEMYIVEGTSPNRTARPRYYNNLVITVTDSVNGKGYTKKVLLKSEPFPGVKISQTTQDTTVYELHTLRGKELNNVDYLYNGTHINMQEYYGKKVNDASDNLYTPVEPSNESETSFYFLLTDSSLNPIDDINYSKETFYQKQGNSDVDSDYVILRKNNISFDDNRKVNQLVLYSNHFIDGNNQCRLYIAPQGRLLESMELEAILSKLSILKNVRINKEAFIYNLYPTSYSFIFGDKAEIIQIKNLDKYLLQNKSYPNKDYYDSDWKEGAIDSSIYQKVLGTINFDPEIESISYTATNGKTGVFPFKRNNEYVLGNETTKIDFNFINDFGVNTTPREWSFTLNTDINIKNSSNIPNFNYYHEYYNDKIDQENQTPLGTPTQYSVLTCNIFSNPKYSLDYTNEEGEDFEFIRITSDGRSGFYQSFDKLYNDVDIYGNNPNKVYLNTYEGYDKDDNLLNKKQYLIEYSYIIDHTTFTGDVQIRPKILISRNEDSYLQMNWDCEIEYSHDPDPTGFTTKIAYCTNVDSAANPNNINWKFYQGPFTVDNGTPIFSYAALINNDNNNYMKISHYNYEYAFEEIPNALSNDKAFVFLYNEINNVETKYYLSADINSYLPNNVSNYEIRYYMYNNIESNYIQSTDTSGLTSTFNINYFSQINFETKYLYHLISNGPSLQSISNYINETNNNIQSQYIYLNDINLSTNFTTEYSVLNQIGVNIDVVNNTNDIQINNDGDGIINNARIIQLSNVVNNSVITVSTAVDFDTLYTEYKVHHPMSQSEEETFDTNYNSEKSSIYTKITNYIKSMFNGTPSFKIYNYEIMTGGNQTNPILSFVKQINSLNLSIIDTSQYWLSINKANRVDIMTIRQHAGNVPGNKINLYSIYNQEHGLRIKYNINLNNNILDDVLYTGVINSYSDSNSNKVFINLYLNNDYIKNIGEFQIDSVRDIKNNIQVEKVEDKTVVFDIPRYEVTFKELNDSSGDLFIYVDHSNLDQDNTATQIENKKEIIYEDGIVRRHEIKLLNVYIHSAAANTIIENGQSIDGQTKVLYISTVKEDIGYYNNDINNPLYYTDYYPVPQNSSSATFEIGDQNHKYYKLQANALQLRTCAFNIYFTLCKENALTRNNYEIIYSSQYPLMKGNYNGGGKVNLSFRLVKGQYPSSVEGGIEYVVNKNQTLLFKPSIYSDYKYIRVLAHIFTNKNPFILANQNYRTFYDLSENLPEEEGN